MAGTKFNKVCVAQSPSYTRVWPVIYEVGIDGVIDIEEFDDCVHVTYSGGEITYLYKDRILYAHIE